MKNTNNKMIEFGFGSYVEGKSFRTVDERVFRGSSGILLFIAVIASINGFILKNYSVLPYITGFMFLNFLIGIFINPKYSPSVVLSSILVRNQNKIPIGAVQKRFAWSLGAILSASIFIMSTQLLNDASWFNSVCMLCLICISLLYLETVFSICVGCKIYHLFLRLKIIPAPKEKPNCMGDSCKII